MNLSEFELLSDLDKSNYLRSNYKPSIKSIAFRRKIAGIGINNADYIAQPKINNMVVRCPAYSAWLHMMQRANQHKMSYKCPTYDGVSICAEWHEFMEFRKWWVNNQVDGWHLDKDILSSNREYSPESCIFVPAWINCFTVLPAKSSYLPAGVSWSKSTKKYQSSCSHPFGKRVHLGFFDSANDAHNAWVSRKLEIALELKQKMDEIDTRIYHGIVRIIKNTK